MEDLPNKASHPGTFTCLMVIVFHVITLGIWLRTAICIIGLIIKNIIKNLEVSLQKQRTHFKIIMQIEITCQRLHHSGPI